MMRCITCDHPLPDGKHHPPYLAQSYLDPQTDDIAEFYQGTKNLLDYLGAVVTVTTDAGSRSQDVQDELIMLARELVDEAQRRLKKLHVAAEIWEKRAEEKQARREGTPDAPQSKE